MFSDCFLKLVWWKHKTKFPHQFIFITTNVPLDLGVPLLEENELEEVQGDCSSLAMENRSIESVITDAVIFKLSSPTDDLG